ncbi:MAG: membrane protein insertion efficiency factor YidD [Mariprofundaceae bacterium]|nr:membrane protein insertion efficiency factor YidD [Mariprofundaceae bacterium]
MTKLVRNMTFSELKIYAMLACVSLIVAGLWHNMRLPAVAPQGLIIHFYQHALGDLDGRSCPSYPVCSVYAREAFQRHGWLWGSWLMIDRLIHEADDLQPRALVGHSIVFEGEGRLYDPLSRNDFWLNDEN